jgi:hypothetical protein
MTDRGLLARFSEHDQSHWNAERKSVEYFFLKIENCG